MVVWLHCRALGWRDDWVWVVYGWVDVRDVLVWIVCVDCVCVCVCARARAHVRVCVRTDWLVV